jgi:hypothetical protein
MDPSFRAILSIFTPSEIMPRCSVADLDFNIIPAGFNALLEFLTGFTFLDGGIGQFIQSG